MVTDPLPIDFSPFPSTSEPAQVGKVALITGGAKRVGGAIALALARQGFDIAITYLTSEREADDLGQQVRALGRRFLAIRADMNQPDVADLVHARLTSHYNRLDALVNNASIFTRAPLSEMTLADFELNMNVNARAPLLLIQRFAPMLAAHAQVEKPWTLGRIINFIDIHVMGQPLKNFIAYNASKAALQEITRTAALELAPQITVNALAPGVVAWPDNYGQEFRERYLERVPLERAGTPQDAADAAVFLICHAHYCTGQTIRLDGGRLWT